MKPHLYLYVCTCVHMYMYMRIYEDVHMCIFMVIATCSALETRYIHDVCFESRVFY